MNEHAIALHILSSMDFEEDWKANVIAWEEHLMKE